MEELSREDVKKLLSNIDDETSEGTLEAARLIKARLREIFAYYQYHAQGSYDYAAVAVDAGRGYVEVSEYIDNAEKRKRLIRGSENKQTPK